MTINFYRVLNVRPDASLDDIRRSYQQLALSLHPDKTGRTDPESLDRFHKVQMAWECLRCLDRRTEYDRQQQHDDISTNNTFTHNIVIQDTIDLDDLMYDGDDAVPWLECRCGSRISVNIDERALDAYRQSANDELLVQCESCSLFYRIASNN
jgi:DnaJ-class molecular chaperone